MEGNVTNKIGPKPTFVTESSRKRPKNEQNRTYSRGRVILGDQIICWKELKSAENLKTDTKVAQFLLDR